jgi:hypothetical protein
VLSFTFAPHSLAYRFSFWWHGKVSLNATVHAPDTKAEEIYGLAKKQKWKEHSRVRENHSRKFQFHCVIFLEKELFSSIDGDLIQNFTAHAVARSLTVYRRQMAEKKVD